MVESYVPRLPAEGRFQDCTSTFKKTSEHKKEDGTSEYLSNSQRIVINFDTVAEKHKEYRCYAESFASNDALYVTDSGEFYFIEFKCWNLPNSTSVSTTNKKKLKDKIAWSLLMADDLGILSTHADWKTRFRYVLVYRKSGLTSDSCNEIDDGIVAQSEMDADIDEVQESLHLPFLDEYKWLFKNVYSFTAEEFEREFIQKIVEPEYLSAGL